MRTQGAKAANPEICAKVGNGVIRRCFEVADSVFCAIKRGDNRKGGQKTQVFALRRKHASLSANDCFALVTATCQENGILLTRDSQLRKVATDRDVRVHGVLWIIEDLRTGHACEAELLISALSAKFCR